MQVSTINWVVLKELFNDTHREEAPSNKTQRLQKERIWTFALLVHQINSL